MGVMVLARVMVLASVMVLACDGWWRRSHGLSARRARRTKSSRPEGLPASLLVYLYFWRKRGKLYPKAVLLSSTSYPIGRIITKIFLFCNKKQKYDDLWQKVNSAEGGGC